MSYQDAKSKNFAKYCKEGKMKLVEKWFDNPNVDVNWNQHSPLRYAVKTGQIEVIKYLLTHTDLRTNYESDRRPLEGSINTDAGWVKGIINPFTQAMMQKNFEILDLFTKGEYADRFKKFRIEHLDILIDMHDDEMNEYFKTIDGFTEYVLWQDAKYVELVSKEAKDIFLF